MTFAPGSTITVREVLHGRVWLELPEAVVADEGTCLATLRVDGCVTFEQPMVRTCDGIDIDDLQRDLVVDPSGLRHWKKDVEHLAPCLESGRIDADQLRHVLTAAAEVTDLLDRDERWWAEWDCWAPDGGE